MSEKRRGLPKEITDAVRRGEEDAKKPSTAHYQRVRRRLENMSGAERRELGNTAQRYIEVLKKRDREIGQLNGAPQAFMVVENFAHKTAERYLDSRRIIVLKKQSIQYSEGQLLVLTPTLFTTEAFGKTQTFWVWVDGDGWVMRDWYLSGYQYNGFLKAHDQQ